MTGLVATPLAQQLWKRALQGRETEKTSTTKSPSLKEVETALRIYESFRLDQIAASQGTKMDQ